MDEKYFFQFKSFKLRNRDSALKINTDGVLLAAWAKLSPYDKVLDIGTGGGVISFILKYRFPNITVHGIDIDGPSIKEANYNLSINNWAKLSFQEIGLQEYSRAYYRNSYDHIISNPPFHTEVVEDKNRLAKAKHTNELNFVELIGVSASLLSFVGKLSLIIPYDRMTEINELAIEHGLHKSREAKVEGKEGGDIKRILLEYCKRSIGKVETSRFHIRANSEKKKFGEVYKSLTKDLYLGF